ncbi:hypothetical protein UA08_02540 [Talaromyces atroroseus]|uniref:Uncharacterized protein n=1 Tax=Talaromyces atroroseus TaxID=1441469 RepID=A0A225ALP7_TALAT|nr:hypothetical protein UA08_02540 [Talaromyces atroroseus]OKL62501.1 hypothetical protein UA08_02540 [Talaromyces atroroseus]
MPMKSLAQSRWAVPERESESESAVISSFTSASSAKARSQELARFLKIVSRLKWKLPFLSEGYRLATAAASPADVAHAEIMFKIDFHEYYALLERAIVHLLAVFDIVVHSSRYKGSSDNKVNGGGTGNHRYHANVLEALEKKSCPLHPSLGSGAVREQLRRAKQLRNQWKTADSSDEDEQLKMPLESYDLEGILMAIFAGLEEAHALAEEHVMKAESDMDVETGNGNISPPSVEADWDFIVDAMDWQAV